jgi:hypothetical protein
MAVCGHSHIQFMPGGFKCQGNMGWFLTYGKVCNIRYITVFVIYNLIMRYKIPGLNNSTPVREFVLIVFYMAKLKVWIVRLNMYQDNP